VSDGRSPRERIGADGHDAWPPSDDGESQRWELIDRCRRHGISVLDPWNVPIAWLWDRLDGSAPDPGVRAFRREYVPAIFTQAKVEEDDHDDAIDRKTFIEIELVDQHGRPIGNKLFRVTLPNGTVYEGTLNGGGFARVDGIDPGNCRVTFPELNDTAWRLR
jgi:hypothetical protein